MSRSCFVVGLAVLAIVSSSRAAVAQVNYETRSWSPTQVSSTPAAIAEWGTLSTDVPGYGATTLSEASNMSNQGIFSGPNTNIAYHVSSTFQVTAAQAGSWSFRYGGDLNYGGTLLIDGVVLQQRWSSMWWAGSWTNASQYLAGTVTMAAGQHTIDMYGFDSCCDGATELDVAPSPGSTYSVFGVTSVQFVGATITPIYNPTLEGTDAFFSIAWTNTAGEAAQLSVALPAGVTLVSATDSGAVSGSNVIWSLASGSGSETLVTNPASGPGTLTLQGSVSTPLESVPFSTSVQVVGAPTITLASTVSPSTVPAGGTLTYELSYSGEAGPTLPGVTISDVLPAGLQFVSASNGGTYNGTSGVVTWTFSSLAAGNSGTLTLSASVPASAPAGTAYTDNATLVYEEVLATANATATSALSLTAQLTNCETSLSTDDGSLAACQSSLSTANTSLLTCGSSLSAAQSSLSSADASLGACEASLSSTQSDDTACQASLGTCTATGVTAQAELDACNSSLDDANSSLSTCDANLSTANGSLSTCEDSNVVLEAELETCNTSLTAAEAARKAIHEHVRSDLEQIVDAMQSDFNDPTFAIPGDDSKARLDALTTAITGLKKADLKPLYKALGGTQ